jgi:hypothetical protein
MSYEVQQVIEYDAVAWHERREAKVIETRSVRFLIEPGIYIDVRPSDDGGIEVHGCGPRQVALFLNASNTIRITFVEES